MHMHLSSLKIPCWRKARLSASLLSSSLPAHCWPKASPQTFGCHCSERFLPRCEKTGGRYPKQAPGESVWQQMVSISPAFRWRNSTQKLSQILRRLRRHGKGGLSAVQVSTALHRVLTTDHQQGHSTDRDTEIWEARACALS